MSNNPESSDLPMHAVSEAEMKRTQDATRRWSWSPETSQWDWMDYHGLPADYASQS
jgi:hypothetical protein